MSAMRDGRPTSPQKTSPAALNNRAGPIGRILFGKAAELFYGFTGDRVKEYS